ncbi:MAG: two-component system cell cycle response regulator [Yoonia sp.]|jgi:two-component system cell cycle response regulator
MVNNLPFTLGTPHQPINVTISVGVAVSNDDALAETAVARLCDCADQALYVAKSAGRNQVAMSKSAA